MANGDIQVIDVQRFSVILLDGQVASDNGQWVETPPKYSLRSLWTDLTAEGSGSPVVAICVSNAKTIPANNTDGVVLVSLTPSALISTAIDSYRWMKAKKTAGGTPVATTCILEAARND